MIVKELIELLNKEPAENPVLFGTKVMMDFTVDDRDGYEVPAKIEFDDWLDFKEIHRAQQAYKDNDRTKTREVTVIEVEY